MPTANFEVATGRLKVVKVEGRENLADAATKPGDRDQVERCGTRVGLRALTAALAAARAGATPSQCTAEDVPLAEPSLTGWTCMVVLLVLGLALLAGGGLLMRKSRRAERCEKGVQTEASQTTGATVVWVSPEGECFHSFPGCRGLRRAGGLRLLRACRVCQRAGLR